MGSMITEDNRRKWEVKRRTTIAKKAFQNKRNLLEVRKALQKVLFWVLCFTVVKPGLKKNVKVPTDSKENVDFEKADMDTLDREKTNVEVLKEMKGEIILYEGKWKNRFISHLFIHHGFNLNIFEDKLLERTGRSKARKRYSDDDI